MGVQNYSNTDTIANGTALSVGTNIKGTSLVALLMPAGWDAAALTFRASQDGTNWSNLYDENGAELTLQVAAGRAIRVPPSLLRGWDYIMLRSGTAAVPVNQTAARSITLTSEWLR